MSLHFLVVLIAAELLFGSGLAMSAGDEHPFGKDLQATIVLHGFTCDRVIRSKRNRDSDYTAVCRDGSRYHVFVNSDGRVVVMKL